MTELEIVFDIGTKDAFGKKTSKTFSRYVESDPSKSRAAPRDVLQRIAKISFKRGWLDWQKIHGWNLHALLMLDHERASEIFNDRKAERDALVKSLVTLRDAAKNTLELISSQRFVSVKEKVASTTRQRENHRQGDELSNLQHSLELLESCLEQSEVSFLDGHGDIPLPDRTKLEYEFPASRFPALSICDFDLYELPESVSR